MCMSTHIFISITIIETPKDIFQFIPDPPRFKPEPQFGLYPKHIDTENYNELRILLVV